MRVYFSILLLILSCLVLARADTDDKKKGKSVSLDIDALRKEINKPTDPPVKREKSAEQLFEVGSVRESILKSSPATEFSEKLNLALKEIVKPSKKDNSTVLGMQAEETTILGIQAQEAIENPSINVIDNHVQEIINTDEISRRFSPDIEEIKKISLEKIQNSDLHNLYRENLIIESIQEEVNFRIGHDVDQWKTISIGDQTVLFGITPHSIVVAMGSNGNYEIITQVEINSPQPKMSAEVMKIWDFNVNKLRFLLLLGVSKDLVWYELVDKKLIEIRRSRLLQHIDKVSYFQHDGSDLIMLTTVDDQERVEVKFYEFNLSTEDLWLVQAFKLPIRPISMVCIDAGRDFIIAFTQDSHVSIYRHQHTKFERGKFSFMRKIDVGMNVSVISGFRIGGHSYLAIGGDIPQIFRYVNGDFQSQAILSQTFGHVEEFLPIPIQIYRDDLVLLVQHRINFGTHTLVAVDALIWNGIAFENTLSVPCQISIYPNANGFSCALDPRRDEGLSGSTFIVENRMNYFHILVPRDTAHSGLFRIKYEIKEAEDPLISQMEQIKKSIELINGMLDYEAAVKSEVEEFFTKSPYNPNNNFEFGNLQLDMIETDILQHIEKVTLESNKIEFLNGVTFDKEDMLALDLLDSMEKTLDQDEERIRQLDAELNRSIRVNRQAQQDPQRTQTSAQPPDSPIYNLGPYNFNGQLNSQTLRVNPLTRNRRQVQPFPDAPVTQLNAVNIDVETINGVPFENYIFLQNGELSMPNTDIIFEESVQVDEDVVLINDGKVNKIDLSREVLAIDSPNGLPEKLSFDTVNVENLITQSMNEVLVNQTALIDLNVSFEDNLPIIKTKRVKMSDNLNVETINGVKWNEFVSKLISKREPSEIESLTVKGDLWVVGDRSEINAKKVNDLNFPQEFVVKRGATETVINGKKTFAKLATSEIDTDGKINGLNPFEMITLDQPQHISSETTFNLIEVVTKLEVNGTISGQKLDEFLPNPTLELTKEILASCNFKDLTVEGDLKVENSFNRVILEKVLVDAVYDNEENVITGEKMFQNLEIKGNTNISSNFINNVNLKDIMTTDTVQEVAIERLQGDVSIANLKMQGLFDNVNPTLLETDSVRTFGDQFIESPLIISKGGRVGASSLDVKISLNDVPIERFCYIDQLIDLPPTTRIEFLDLSVENLKVDGDILGTGTLSNLNLQEFANNRLSKSLVQTISAPVEVDTLTTRNVFNGASINGLSFDKFKTYMVKMKDFSKSLLSGEQKIDTLIVDGNAVINFINDRDLRALMANVIWIDRTNNFDEIHFLDSVNIKNLTVSLVNGRNFDKFVQNWVSKTENPVKIQADITFAKDVIVTGNLAVREINNIKFEDFLRKDDVVEVESLNLFGSLKTDSLTVKNKFNGVMQQQFSDLYSYDKATDYHIVHADVNFHHPTRVAYLNTAFFNGRDVAKWLDSLIRVYDNHVTIEGPKVFTRDVMAQSGLLIDVMNGINLKEVIKNIITVNNDLNIYGDLIFENDVYADLVALRGNLSTDNISGCFLKEWMHYVLPTTKHIVHDGEIRMQASDFQAKYLTVTKLNGIPFDHILTLNTEQQFDYLKVEGPVKVLAPLNVRKFFTQGSKGFIDLRMERENSVLVHDSNVTITTPIIFKMEAMVLDSITCKGHINGKRIEDIVLLNSSPVFDTSMNLQSLEAQSINSEYLISGNDFNKWYKSRVWKRSNEPQIITSKWNVTHAKFNSDCSGNGLINGRSINQIQKNLNENVNQVQAFLSNYSGQYNEMCMKLQGQVEDYGHSSVHILKYLELDFKIIEDRDIYSYYDFSTKNGNYLIVNFGCNSKVYLWMKSKQKYQETSFAETGIIYDYASVVYENGDFFIITNSKVPSDAPCNFNGLNSWKLVDHKLIHITSIKTDGAVNKIFSHKDHFKLFYALDSTYKVISFDAFGTRLEEWKLPAEGLSYSFLPHKILQDLHLYNGRRIFSLESKRRRSKRWWFGDTEGRKEQRSQTNKKFVINPPDYSLPTINQFSMQPLSEENFLTKIRNAGETIKASFTKGLPEKSDSKFKMNWPKIALTKNKENSTENHEEVKDAEGNKMKLLFTIKNPDMPKGRAMEEKDDEKPKDLIKNVGSSILDAMMNPFGNKSTTAAPEESLKEESEASTTQSPENATELMSPETPEERQAETTVVQTSGVRDMENSIIPEHGEIIVIEVGPADQKKRLYAVSRKRSSIVVSGGDKGNDFIEIYSDIVESRVFQYIQCKNPSDITALHFRDETLLAFIESRREVQILIYRGIQGFSFFKSIRLNQSAHHMSAITTPPKIPYKCSNHYLVIQFNNELQFMKVKIDGNCGLSHVECDGN